MASSIKDNFKIGSKAIVVADCDLRGEISIGPGTIIHPRSTIVAMAGPIIIGSNCIIEEKCQIVNRSKRPMVIGDNNLFQVFCRVEAVSIGSWNTFGARCRVTHTIAISSYCNIGAGCTVLASPFPPAFVDIDEPPTPPPKEPNEDETMGAAAPTTKDPPGGAVSDIEKLQDYTVVYGSESKRRKWTGEGVGQAKALHAKHLASLTELIPKFHKLKMFT
ncbi:trimeric LpxA-like protein [Meredithblackwellia eburnea MCA 4105]